MNTDDDDDDDELIWKSLQRNVLQNHVMSITHLLHPPAQSSAIKTLLYMSFIFMKYGIGYLLKIIRFLIG